MTLFTHILIAAIATPVALAAICHAVVWLAARRRTFNEASAVPPCDFAMVLGAPPVRSDGRPNRYYVRRVRAAAMFHATGSTKRLIVSGNAHHPLGDEVAAMRQALVEAGVSEPDLFNDGGSVRTLQSVLAARDLFGACSVVFVSQRFHNERAVFLARTVGLNAYGFNAEDVHGGKAPIVALREAVARIRAVADACRLLITHK